MQIRSFVATRIGAMTMGTIEHEQFVALVRGCACGWITSASAAPDAAVALNISPAAKAMPIAASLTVPDYSFELRDNFIPSVIADDHFPP